MYYKSSNGFFILDIFFILKADRFTPLDKILRDLREG